MIRDSFGVLNEMVITEHLGPEIMTQWQLSKGFLPTSSEDPQKSHEISVF